MASRKNSIDVFLRLRDQRKFSKEGAAAAATLENLGLRGAKHVASFAASSQKLKDFGQSWTRNVTVPVTIGAALAGKAAVDWESSFAGVRKTVDATEGQYASMEKGLRSMALQIPVAANDLAGIAEAAGQLGIKRKSILSFTRTVADLGVATNLAGEEGATTLARFANITQMPQSQFRRLGSTVVALGNAGASTEKDIAGMGLRLAAAGTFAGMSEANVLAIANALSSVGIEAEAGGTAMSTAIKTLNSAVVGNTPLLEDFAGIAGTTGERFAQSWKRDAAGTMTSWIEGLARLKAEGKDVPAILYDLGTTLRGTRVQDTLMRAAGAGELLRESITLGNKSWRDNTALTEEAEERYKTVASRLQILKNKFIDAGISLGQQLLPPLIDLVNFAGPKIGVLAEQFGALPGPVKATALGLLILTGPVASGLGYFAAGMGKALVMVAALGRAGKSMAIFTTALQAGQGLSGASSIAFEGIGQRGALSTAKGFALSLGPAAAAFGVGNIVTSALESDWKTVGFEAGGAAAGGIAGFFIGGPLGAMLGAGIGTLAGDLGEKLFDGIFGSAPKIPPLQAKLARSAKEVARYFKEQKAAGLALARSGSFVKRANDGVRASSAGVRRAEQRLTQAKRSSGAQSRNSAKAEWRLTVAQDRRRHSVRKLDKAERVKGQQLRWYKQITRTTVLEERNRINNLQKQLGNVRKLYTEEVKAGAPRARLTELAKKGIGVSNALAGAQRKHKETLMDAAQKAGPKFARFLENANRQSLELGSAIKALNSRLRTTQELSQSLNKADLFAVPDLGNMGTGLPQGPPTPINPPRSGGSTGTSGSGGGRRSRTRSLMVPPPRNAGLLNKPVLDLSGLAGEGGTFVLQNILDGKVISESVARRAEDQAAYQA